MVRDYILITGLVAAIFVQAVVMLVLMAEPDLHLERAPSTLAPETSPRPQARPEDWDPA